MAQTSTRDEVIFFFNDAQGSAVAAVNESGDLCWREEYTAYGDKNINDDLVSEVGCGIIGEERGFTGHTEDVNSDLVYMQQRYYDPSIGRFLSIDPVDANPNEPMTFNRYAYANNNPYSYVDPNGELPVLVWAAYVGVQAALTAYDSYSAYQEGGAPALAKQAAVDIALSVAGAKVAAKVAEGAITGARALDNVSEVPTSKDIKVLGRLEDTAVARDWDGHDVLNIKDWTIERNDQWIAEGIKNKQDFYIASPTEGNLWNKAANRETVFSRELNQVKDADAGYVRKGDNYTHPDNR
ncbi:RHS repeat-associated core domain-containing protein [bacterium]|nr:RHS repeat-associated core domain-containing protein [bacterium]